MFLIGFPYQVCFVFVYSYNGIIDEIHQKSARRSSHQVVFRPESLSLRFKQYSIDMGIQL